MAGPDVSWVDVGNFTIAATALGLSVINITRNWRRQRLAAVVSLSNEWHLRQDKTRQPAALHIEVVNTSETPAVAKNVGLFVKGRGRKQAYLFANERRERSFQPNVPVAVGIPWPGILKALRDAGITEPKVDFVRVAIGGGRLLDVRKVTRGRAETDDIMRQLLAGTMSAPSGPVITGLP